VVGRRTERCSLGIRNSAQLEREESRDGIIYFSSLYIYNSMLGFVQIDFYLESNCDTTCDFLRIRDLNPDGLNVERGLLNWE